MLPSTLLESLQGVTGYDETAFVAVHEAAVPPVSIRFNPDKFINTDALPFSVGDKVPWAAQGFYLAERPIFTLDPLLHAGVYYVQEASSMFLEQAIKTIGGSEKPINCLDLCAAPGGKSTHLQSLLHPASVLVCNEVIQLRNAILVENLTKWGGNNVLVTQNDPLDFGKLPDLFDVIVVDAPCSGSGLFRRDAAAIKEWSLEAVELCGRRQQRILADVLPALRPGGYLIYSTCSYSPAEDEHILDWLHQEFGMKGIEIHFSNKEDGVVATSSLRQHLPCYRFFPNRVKGEGLFMALLQKPMHDFDQNFSNKKHPAPLKIPEAIAHWVNNPVQLSAFQHKDDWYVMSQSLHTFFMQVKDKLRVRKAGVKIAQAVQKQFLPQHGLALSTNLHQSSFIILDLNLEEALNYLRREPLDINHAPKGWLLISYQGFSLGWIKNMGNRNNNYYPKEWRVRMQG